jgi:hypothetical protein
MQALRNWSFAKVSLVAAGWVLLCVLAMVAWIVFQFRGAFDASSGSGGIGAVTFGFNVLVLAIPIVPPAILIVAWLAARRS